MFGKKRNDDEYFIGKKKRDSTFGERVAYAAIAVGSCIGLVSVQDPLAQMFFISFAMAGSYLTVFPR